MPPTDEPLSHQPRPLQAVVDDLGVYPPEAFEFVQRGLSFTVSRIHGTARDSDQQCHIRGQDLCFGLRDYALSQWGLLARIVLTRWNITSTFDFGRIVFALVNNGNLRKTQEDSIEDFRNVFDFNSAFDTAFSIECKS